MNESGHGGGEEARAVYVDHDLAVLAAARAWWEHPARVCGSRVHVVDLDLRPPEFLTAVLGERFDLSVPVGVVSSLTLDHLEDGEVTRLAEVLAARLAPGSGWGITHLSKVEQAARVYTAQARRQGADTRMVARAPHRLRGLFEGTGWGRWSTSVPREPFRGESPITALITLAKPT